VTAASPPDGGEVGHGVAVVPDRLGAALQSADAVWDELPPGAAGALARMPGTALNPFDARARPADNIPIGLLVG